MTKSWIIAEFLREMTDGFYIDINSDSDESSPTKLLDVDFRWRGMFITPTAVPVNRTPMCVPVVKDFDAAPKGIVQEIYKAHMGTMLHYVYIHRMTNLKEFFNEIYRKDVEIPFSNEKVWPHLNFIGLEINMQGHALPDGLEQQLYAQFDVKPYKQLGTSFLFVNEILYYLL